MLESLYCLSGDTGITFLDDQGGRQRISYESLGRQARMAAPLLRARGVRPGSLVAMTLTNDLASMVALLATWAAGATVVSVPPPPRRAQHVYATQFRSVLDVMGCQFMLADDPLIGPGLTGLSKSALLQADLGEEIAVPAPEHALVQFTSGSIAEPKGVAVTSSALVSHLTMLAKAFDYGRDGDRLSSWLPLYHDMGLLVMIMAALTAGIDQVLATPQSFITRPASWMTTVAREGATITGGPDFAYRIASRVRYEPAIDLSRVRLCLSGGERVDWQSLVGLHDAVGRFGLRFEAFAPCYGLAEATVGLTCTPPDRGPVRGPGGLTSVGHPFPEVDLHLPGGEVPGPIQVSSPWLLDGYYTSRGFIKHTSSILDTGDAGFQCGKEIFVIGRVAEMLTVAGRNVFAEDIEAVAYHAGGRHVRGCAAYRSADQSRFCLLVEADPQLAAPEGLGRQVLSEVSGALGLRLAYTAVVTSRTIPRTTSGKVQRAQARDAYESGALASSQLAVVE
jgi:acyl-CoA synthetase (AMP-forming)/AMP-acid ligase II